MDLGRALTNTLRRGEILVDPATTTAVKYLDLLPLFHDGEKEIYVRVLCDVALRVTTVESETPDTEPTTVATSGDAAMDRLPAEVPEHVTIYRDLPVLAYSADGGLLTVRRASPRQP